MAIDKNTFKILKTLCVYISFIVSGLTMSLGGPSVPDMCDRLAVTAEELSIAFSVQSIMWTVGAILLGPVIDRYQNHVDLQLALALVVMGLSCLLKPFSSELWQFVTASATEALGFAGIDLAGNSLMFSIWGEKASSPLQGLHASWGIGFAVGPLLIKPFLGPDIYEHAAEFFSNLTYTADYSTVDHNISKLEAPRESHIETAYIISSVFALATALLFFVHYHIGVPNGLVVHLKSKSSFKEVFSCKSIVEGDRIFGITILIMLSLFYFACAGQEDVFFTWLFSYAIESDLHFTKQEAAMLDAAAKFSFLTGRVLAAVVALFVPIQPMLLVEVHLVMVFVICLMAYGTQTKIYLWVFVSLVNLCYAPVWASGLAWADRYIVVSGIVFTVMNVGAGAAGLVFHWITGYIFTHHSPHDVMYLIILCSTMLCVTLISMQIIASCHGSRFHGTEESVDGNKDDKEC